MKDNVLSGLMKINESQSGFSIVFDSQELLDKLSGNKDIYQRIVTKFLADADQLINEIVNLSAKQDWESCRNQVHGLKGMAATVCAKRMQYHCKHIENAIDNNEFDKISASVVLLKNELLTFKEAI